MNAAELERLQAGAFPRRMVGRPTPVKERAYQTALVAWCATFEEIKATLDFDVSSRGWCYLLEGRAGLFKGDFDACLALGLAACQRGFSVNFFTAAGLVHQLINGESYRLKQSKARRRREARPADPETGEIISAS
jgi:hypothetical protein